MEYLDDKRPDPVKKIPVATTSKDNRNLLPVMDAAQLKAVLIETFREPDCRNVLSEIFRPLVSESEGRLLSRIDSLQKELANRDVIISTLETQVKTLECKIDDMEQSTRNKFLRFQGIPELANENTDDLIIKCVKDNLDITIKNSDIDYSHRIGKNANRPILFKFMSMGIRQKIFRAKKSLRNKGVILYINEDLVKKRADMFAMSRQLKKDRFIIRTWTSEGTIFYVEMKVTSQNPSRRHMK